MSELDRLTRANEPYASSFEHGALPAAPGRRLAVVTCMDARLLPSRFLGLREGDAHVIRNAGGSAREALRSLVISQRLLGTQEVAIVKHTGCGMLTFSNEDLYAKVREDLGADASGIDFEPFGSLEDAVREDVDFLRSSPLIGEDVAVRGFVYDVESGRLSELSG
jgi:carbonic anhydrase